MLNKLMTSAVIASALMIGAQVKAAPVDITVTAAEKADAKHTVVVAFFNSQRTWDASNEPTPDKVVKFKGGPDGSKHTVDLAPGTYAFFIYNDLDEDGDCAKGFMGMPAEPYSFSNNVKIGMSKPTWSNISFKVTDKGATQTIKLKN